MERKILIIKTGYTETLCNEPYKEGNVSLGDVLRTTALLHLYKNDDVTWLTDTKAVPLLANNSYIKRILEFSVSAVLQLEYEYYDVVVNLEKNPGICALASRIHCQDRFGFSFNTTTGEAWAYNNALQALYVAKDDQVKRTNDMCWLEHLYELVGSVWDGEGYVLGYVPQEPPPAAIVGMNWHVGSKFGEKGWNGWDALTLDLRTDGITYSRQPHPDNFYPLTDLRHPLERYMDWISAHAVLVTCDSLGLHLAMAMGKCVVGLFGPTPAKEIHPYAKGIMIQEKQMSEIGAGVVGDAVRELLNWGQC